TLRLLVGNLEGNKLNKIYTDRIVTRLGENLTKSPILSEESIKSSIDALIKFKRIAEKYNVFCIIAFGTSALREAKNSNEFCKLAEKATGIKINVFTEKQEAYYTFLGVTEETSYENIFILDVGGGSSEWIYSNTDSLLIDSISVGVLKIKELFLKKDLPLQEDLNNAKRYIRKEIENRIPNVKIEKIIATGGTASTAAMIFCRVNSYCPEKTHKTEISIDKLKSMLKYLSSIPISERKKVIGLSPDRADIICSGLLILETFLEYLCANALVISETGIIEGVIKNYKIFCYNKNL
ncbi:MAG: hypothetical protein ABDH16_00305, partial [Thermodesulfovibrionaceae bacterium]